jgi:hypothetical protein
MKAIFFYILFGCIPMLYAQDAVEVSFFEMPNLGNYSLEGIGTHIRNNHYAINIFAGILEPDPLSPFMCHVHAQYVIYPKNSFFVGTGLGLLREPRIFKGISGGFTATIGYEWNTNTKTTFSIETNAMIPFKKSESTARAWPNLSFNMHF